jgi:hypothetical protein
MKTGGTCHFQCHRYSATFPLETLRVYPLSQFVAAILPRCFLPIRVLTTALDNLVPAARISRFAHRRSSRHPTPFRSGCYASALNHPGLRPGASVHLRACPPLRATSAGERRSTHCCLAAARFWMAESQPADCLGNDLSIRENVLPSLTGVSVIRLRRTPWDARPCRELIMRTSSGRFRERRRGAARNGDRTALAFPVALRAAYPMSKVFQVSGNGVLQRAVNANQALCQEYPAYCSVSVPQHLTRYPEWRVHRSGLLA